MAFLRRVRIPLLTSAAAILATCAFATSAAVAADGDIDLAFGVGGVSGTPAITNMTSAGASAMAVQPDGKILLAGAIQISFGFPSLAVQRNNADGSPDASFDGDGVALATIPGATSSTAVDVAVRPDGKIVVAFEYLNGSSKYEYAVARFRENGTLDDTFDGNSGSGNGVVHAFASDPTAPDPSDRPWDATFDADGGIAISGDAYTGVGLTGDTGVVRFDENGFRDTGFSGDGRAQFNTWTTDRGWSIESHPAGGYVVAGEAVRGSGPTVETFALYRVTAAGNLDPAFTGGPEDTSTTPGVVIVTLGSEADDYSRAYAVRTLPDGRILAAGYTYDVDSVSRPVVARFLADGSLDPTFGVNGRLIFSFGGDHGAVHDLVVDSFGRILVTGYVSLPSGQFTAVARLGADGTLGSTFGAAGVRILDPVGSFSGHGGGSAIGTAMGNRVLVSGVSLTAPALSAVRLFNDPPVIPNSAQPPTPTATITSPKSRSVKRKRLKRFAGTAGPVGEVAKVEIALQKVDKRLLKKRKRCRWLSSSKAKFRLVKATRGKCSKPRFLKATGTESWFYRLRKLLPKGSYRLLVRVTLADGRAHTTFTAAGGNLRAFRIK